MIISDPTIIRQTGYAQPWVLEVGYKDFEAANTAALATAMNNWALTLKNSPNQYLVQPPVYLNDKGNNIRAIVPYLLWIPPPEPL